jgi:methionine-S-sulfoxide reductase
MHLKIFFESHDPTTLNKQGADIGTQYRSAIFYNDDKQKKSAVKYNSILNKSNKFKELFLTEITKLDIFYDAENYHQNYYKNNPNLPYCELIIKPKLDKVLTK